MQTQYSLSLLIKTSFIVTGKTIGNNEQRIFCDIHHRLSDSYVMAFSVRPGKINLNSFFNLPLAAKTIL
jgi:hypothetical protein